MAIGVMLLAFLAIILEDYGRTAISILGSVYPGYRPDVPGAVLGAIWGFIDGAVGGYIFAWLYNYFGKLLRKQ